MAGLAWRRKGLLIALPVLIWLLTGCTGDGQQGAGPGAGHTSAATSSPTASSPSATGATRAPSNHKLVYARGMRTLRQFLASWERRGLPTAARTYLQSAYQPAPGQPGPDLRSWRIIDYRPISWTSSAQFTVEVELRMRFAGPPIAWSQGRNTRFVTFTRSDASPSGYTLALATSP